MNLQVLRTFDSHIRSMRCIDLALTPFRKLVSVIQREKEAEKERERMAEHQKWYDALSEKERNDYDEKKHAEYEEWDRHYSSHMRRTCGWGRD